MKHILKTICMILVLTSSMVASADNLANITLNPLRVELSALIRGKLREADPNFSVNTIENYTRKVHEIFLDDAELLTRETPMVVLGHFDCDDQLDIAVMGSSEGRPKIFALVSTQGYRAMAVNGLPKSSRATDNLDRYLSVNTNIPIKPSKCGGRRKIDLLQSEQAYGDTKAFVFLHGKWVSYTGQDL